MNRLSTLAGALQTRKGRKQLRASGERLEDLMCDIVCDLEALHESGIVHGDLTPHSVVLLRVLITGGIRAELVSQEQGSSKSHGDNTSGSQGWQAPEQLVARGNFRRVPQSRSTDVFSLGCVLYYTATMGQHPFGDDYERDNNILDDEPRLNCLQHDRPEAANLVAAMLAKDAAQRPFMQAVRGHPTFWPDEHKQQFLVDICERVAGAGRPPDASCLAALEAYAPCVIPSSSGNWLDSLDEELIHILGQKRRKYNGTSVRDLLRVMRSVRDHFQERFDEGDNIIMLRQYFTERFPNLLLSCFFFGLEHLQQEEELSQYWPGGPALYRPFTNAFHSLHWAHLLLQPPPPPPPPRRRQSPPPPPPPPPPQPPQPPPPQPSRRRSRRSSGQQGDLLRTLAVTACPPTCRSPTGWCHFKVKVPQVDWQAVFAADTSTFVVESIAPGCERVLFPEGLQAYVVEQPQDVADALARLRRSMLDKVVAIDMEWKPDRYNGSNNPVALLQLSSATVAVLIRTSAAAMGYELPDAVRAFLADPHVCILGQAWDRADEHKMRSTFQLGRDDIAHFIDLQRVACDLGYSRTGLKAMAQEVIGVPLAKSKNVTCSNWAARRPLSLQQVKYAALDVLAAGQIFRVLRLQHYYSLS